VTAIRVSMVEHAQTGTTSSSVTVEQDLQEWHVGRSWTRASLTPVSMVPASTKWVDSGACM